MTLACKTADLLLIATHALNHLTSSAQQTLLPAEQSMLALQQLTATVLAAAKLADVAHVEALTARGGAGGGTAAGGCDVEGIRAEAEKAKNETERLKAEAEKVGKEAERAVAETERFKAEAMMIRSEKMRIDAETERLKAETEQKKVEAEGIGGEHLEGSVQENGGEKVEVESKTDTSEVMGVDPQVGRSGMDTEGTKAEAQMPRVNSLAWWFASDVQRTAWAKKLTAETVAEVNTDTEQREVEAERLSDEAVTMVQLQEREVQRNESRRVKGKAKLQTRKTTDDVQARKRVEGLANMKAELDGEQVEVEELSEEGPTFSEWEKYFVRGGRKGDDGDT